MAAVEPLDPGGGPHNGPGEAVNQVRPKKTFADAAQVAGKVPGGRTWEQIIADSKQKRNILELHMSKQKDPSEPNTPSDNSKVKHLTFDELSIFIFDVLKIKQSDTEAIDYTTGSYGHREIELKQGVDFSSYLTGNTPVKYLGHDIIVKKQQTNNTTKILFRNVPLNVPDEEIINLSMCYGQPQGWVNREKLFNIKDRGKVGSNRTVEVLLNDGASFENYYWLEGPLPGDQGRRITVTHQGQPQQCSHCFSNDFPKYDMPLSQRCPAQGNGRACKLIGTPRARMTPYMKDLERTVGFTTLKIKQARLGGNRAGYEINEDKDLDQVEEELIYKTPIMERDERILTLEKEKDELNSDLPELKEKVKKLTKQLEAEKKEKTLKEIRVSKAMNITEQRVAEAIKSDYSFLVDNPQLITILSLFQERSEFEVDMINGVVKPIQEEGFLEVICKDINDITEPAELSIPMDMVKERVGEVKNKVLEGPKRRWIKNDGGSRRNSISSMVSSQSKRDRESFETDGRMNRQRLASPSDQD